MIVVFSNAKGGVGKTTSAVYCGQVLADAGRRVGLLDLDRQATARLWAEQAAANGTPLGARIVEWTGHGRSAIPAALLEADEHYDDVVVDTSPADLNDLMHTLSTGRPDGDGCLVDIVVVPSRALPADYVQLQALRQAVAANRRTRTLPVYGLLTMTRRGMLNYDRVRTMLAGFDPDTGRRYGLTVDVPLRESEVTDFTFVGPPRRVKDGLYEEYERVVSELRRLHAAELAGAR